MNDRNYGECYYQVSETDVKASVNMLRHAAKHLRRLSNAYVDCHKDCLCGDECEHPDKVIAETSIGNMLAMADKLDN